MISADESSVTRFNANAPATPTFDAPEPELACAPKESLVGFIALILTELAVRLPFPVIYEVFET